MLKKFLLVIFIPGFFVHLTAQTLNATEIFNKVSDSVVKVYGIDFEGIDFGQGSGVVIDSNVIATNYHNFDGCKKLKVVHYNKEFDNVKILYANPENDVLILFINYLGLSPIRISDSVNIVVGEKIYAVGSPKNYENTITEGIISGIRIEKNESIQISAGITHGSSGGAVVNEKGELIGISTAGYEGTSLNFAIPVSLINKSKWCNITDDNCQKVNYYYCELYNLISYTERLLNIYYYNDKLDVAIDSLKNPLKNISTRDRARELIYFIIKRFPIQRLNIQKLKELTDYMGKGFSELLEALQRFELRKDFYGGYEKIIDAIRKEPQNSYYYYILGQYYGKQGYLEFSIKNIIKAYQMGDKDAKEWLSNRGMYIPERSYETKW